jgi:hypothetical protein
MLTRARLLRILPARLALARSYAARADPPEGQEPPLPTPSERPYTASTLHGEDTPRGQEPPLEERILAAQAAQAQAQAAPAAPAGQTRPEIPLPPPPKEGGSSKSEFSAAALTQRSSSSRSWRPSRAPRSFPGTRARRRCRPTRTASSASASSYVSPR